MWLPLDVVVGNESLIEMRGARSTLGRRLVNIVPEDQAQDMNLLERTSDSQLDGHQMLQFTAQTILYLRYAMNEIFLLIPNSVPHFQGYIVTSKARRKLQHEAFHDDTVPLSRSKVRGYIKVYLILFSIVFVFVTTVRLKGRDSDRNVGIVSQQGTNLAFGRPLT